MQGATILSLNISAFTFTVAFGIAISSASLVGNALGAKNTQAAKLYAKVSIWFSVAVSTFMSLFLYTFRYQLASIFTSHEEIKELI